MTVKYFDFKVQTSSFSTKSIYINYRVELLIVLLYSVPLSLHDLNGSFYDDYQVYRNALCKFKK